MSTTKRWSLGDIAEGLRSMRSAAGHPSYAEIAKRIGKLREARGVPTSEQRPARATVYDCFRTDRRRLDIELVVDITRALGADETEATRWAQTCRAAQNQADAATVVTAHADLPTPVEHFVGRGNELTTIINASENATASHVFCIEGMPGSGKTQLAIAAAHHLLAHGHVDAVLHADLRGYHPDNPPADPAAVLDTFLRLLDVPPRQIPAGLAQRRTLYQERLATRRHVIVLDDADSAEQVSALLPNVPDTTVLITSRAALNPTALNDDAEFAGAVRMSLDVFEPHQAVELLRDVVGTELVDTDLASATKLVEASGYLPLAVALTATRVATRPGWTLADHLEPLRHRRSSLRLDEAIHATIDLSYTALSPRAQTTLRLLAAHPCADLDTPAIAALADRDNGQAQTDLDELVTHHLVSRPRPGRYALHALVRTYALDRSYDHDRPAERVAAVERLCRHYEEMVWAGYQATFKVLGFTNRQAPEHLDVPALEEGPTKEWLQTNIENILTLASHGAELGRPDLAVHLSEGTSWWLNQFGRYQEARLLHQLALEAARHLGYEISEARANLDLGQILVRLSEWDAGTKHLAQAEHTFAATNDLYGTCSAVNALAIVDVMLGRLSEGIARLQRSVELSRAAGNGHGTASALDNIAVAHRRAGRLAEAVTYHSMALEQAKEIGDRHMQARSSINVSEVQRLLGAYDDALRSAQHGLTLAQELNNTLTAAYGHDNVANVQSVSGDYEGALRHYHEALELCRHNDRHLEAGVLNNLGTTYLRMGEHERARSSHDEAYAVSTKINDTFEQARALAGIGSALAAEGSTGDARQHLVDALSVFEQLGSPEATDVRDQLARLPVG